jgi:hypothetical protein
METYFRGVMSLNSSELRERLVEMHAVLGEDTTWRTKEDLLKIDRDHFPSTLGHSTHKFSHVCRNALVYLV